MTNFFDYLKWRGDLTVNQAEFNNVDALILSRLSYIPFEGIVTGEFSQKITVGEAAEIFFAMEEKANEVNMPQDTELLRAIAKCDRFIDMSLSGYVNEIDLVSQKQFSAITIDICDGSHFISYRGTDNTLVGWKEDFNMSFTTPVPAQTDAVHYLEKVADAVPGYIRAGGHSKGGNLAVYAAAFCTGLAQARILNVYNNDGPGLDSSVILKDGYVALKSRIHTFIPQSSVVGMLLEHEEDYVIVRSTQIGLLQHDVYSWEVMGKDFICLESISNSSKVIDRTLKGWLSELEPAQREQFIDAMYSIFKGTNAQTLKELTANWYKNALFVLKSLSDMDEPVKQVILKTLHALIRSVKQNMFTFKPTLPSRDWI